MSNFNENLKKMLEVNQLTISELAKKTSIPYTTIQNYLKSDSIPNVENAFKIAQVFNCSMEFLLGIEKKTEGYNKEKLNDLMNRISFALKDATLAQGFEIICKRLTDLENDRHELLDKIKAIKEVLNIEEIYRLKKENEELKKFCEDVKQIEEVSDFRWEENQKLKKENEELKAKIEVMKQYSAIASL